MLAVTVTIMIIIGGGGIISVIIYPKGREWEKRGGNRPGGADEGLGRAEESGTEAARLPEGRGRLRHFPASIADANML